MRKLIFGLPAVMALLLVAAPAALAADAAEGGVTVMVMKHACNDDIQSLEDFNAVKTSADSPAGALAATVLACPTIVNPGDETSDGIAGEPVEFSFTLEDANGTHQLPSSSEPAKLCESDLGIDANGDGNVSEDVCLDTTHYVFSGVATGDVTLTETSPPAGFSFGELLFTPSEIDGNNDGDTLVSLDRDAGVIELDTSADDDGMIMLHIYNFPIQMPDSSTEPETAVEAVTSNIGLLLAIGAVAAFGFWLAVGQRRREADIRGEE